MRGYLLAIAAWNLRMRMGVASKTSTIHTLPKVWILPRGRSFCLISALEQLLNLALKKPALIEWR